MGLPTFHPTRSQREWVDSERRTAGFIRAFWGAASAVQRRDREFLWFLTASAWTNARNDDSGYESTREWRNKILASYLDVEYQKLHDDLERLAAAISRAMPKFTVKQARGLLNRHTGITHHYTPIRPYTRRYVLRHAARLHDLFASVSSGAGLSQITIKKVAGQLAKMPSISTPQGGKTSPFNPLSPVLACLDPRRRFPIMNQRTSRLLRAIGKKHDGDGALALYRLIGLHGIRDSFELDVYSQVAERSFPSSSRRATSNKSRGGARRSRKLVGVKSELASFAHLAARRVRIRKEHNKLVNRFRETVFAHIRPQEAEYDLLVDHWKNRRSLLIEAKTAWEGPSGRTQIRQAIGQLFDYRLRYFPDNMTSVDMAVLVPTEPNDEIKCLLRSVGIAAIWFRGRRLASTIRLPW